MPFIDAGDLEEVERGALLERGLLADDLLDAPEPVPRADDLPDAELACHVPYPFTSRWSYWNGSPYNHDRLKMY